MKLNSGKMKKPYFITIYGPPGVGKSSLSAEADAPIFIDVESGTQRLDVVRFSDIQSFDDVMKALTFCNDEEKSTKFNTVVIDTLDFLEQLIHAKVCSDNKKSSIADISYGKGYDFAVEIWFKLFEVLDQIRDKGKNIILISHEQITKYENPTSDNYDRYSLRLHKKIASFIFAKCDAVLFLSKDVFVKEQNGKNIAVSKPGRVIFAQEQASIIAKNRFGLPEKFEIKNGKDLFSKLTEG